MLTIWIGLLISMLACSLVGKSRLLVWTSLERLSTLGTLRSSPLLCKRLLVRLSSSPVFVLFADNLPVALQMILYRMDNSCRSRLESLETPKSSLKLCNILPTVGECSPALHTRHRY